MILGKVVGTVVSSIKEDGLEGIRYLLIEKCSQHGVVKGDYLVAHDLVGANRDELVMISEGSAARETPITINKPVDAAIVGIIDLIDQHNEIVYRKP